MGGSRGGAIRGRQGVSRGMEKAGGGGRGGEWLRCGAWCEVGREREPELGARRINRALVFSV